MFERSIELFAKYRKQEFDSSGSITNYAGELQNRIFQIKWLIEQAQHLHNQIASQRGQDIDFDALRILEIYTESFYHFAWRIIEITKKNSQFKSIPRRCGIYDVRNHLIQHVEGNERKNEAKSFSMFSGGGVNGPEIKGYIGPENSINDAGLFKNAKDFEILLNDTLSELINDA